MSGRSYYEAVAQIIPILFLTMAVGEARVRIRETISPRNAVIGVLFIAAVLVAGEIAALRSLEAGHGTRLAKDLTALAMAVGLGWIVRTLAGVVARDRTEDAGEPPPEITVLIDGAFFVTAVCVGCALIL
jgi:hypothetical protein